MNKFTILKAAKIRSFDPSDIGLDNGNLFGLPFTIEESEVVVIPVPWEVTTSYGEGTARGPEAILSASLQVDLFDPDIQDAWKIGIGMLPISKTWMKRNTILRGKAKRCIHHLEHGGSPHDIQVKKFYEEINRGCRELNTWIKNESSKLLQQGKSVCVLGGEHSVPLGFMQALTKFYPTYSILHIDAHADLRKAYEGFEFSHASIQYNASKIKNIDHMVQVGIRDYSEQEADRIKNSDGRIITFTDQTLARKQYQGVTWNKLCEDIIKSLGKNVYISFDIDALQPSLCPHSGTPVPGGLEFDQSLYLIETLVKSNRKIIGFDLCEVAPAPDDDWDSVVGVRMLYRLANLMAKSQGKL